MQYASCVFQPPVIPHTWGIFKNIGDTPKTPPEGDPSGFPCSDYRLVAKNATSLISGRREISCTSGNVATPSLSKRGLGGVRIRHSGGGRNPERAHCMHSYILDHRVGARLASPLWDTHNSTVREKSCASFPVEEEVINTSVRLTQYSKIR